MASRAASPQASSGSTHVCVVSVHVRVRPDCQWLLSAECCTVHLSERRHVFTGIMISCFLYKAEISNIIMMTCVS